ncbi:MAG: tetratricopeptide repeat protein, partial [Lentisphaerae bacterium]|nr:tetratricopeptide repeat protein [Lentisphaerota bacterium]
MRRNNDPGSGRRMVARLAAGALGVLIGVCAAPARADAPFLDPVLTAIDRTLIDEAIAEAQTSGDVDVPVPKALLYKGLILFQGEDYTTAIPYLEEALRQDPTLVGAWEALGWA